MHKSPELCHKTLTRHRTRRAHATDAAHRVDREGLVQHEAAPNGGRLDADGNLHTSAGRRPSTRSRGCKGARAAASAKLTRGSSWPRQVRQRADERAHGPYRCGGCPSGRWHARREMHATREPRQGASRRRRTSLKEGGALSRRRHVEGDTSTITADLCS